MVSGFLVYRVFGHTLSPAVFQSSFPCRAPLPGKIMGGCGTIKVPTTDISTPLFFLLYHSNKNLLASDNFFKLNLYSI